MQDRAMNFKVTVEVTVNSSDGTRDDALGHLEQMIAWHGLAGIQMGALQDVVAKVHHGDEFTLTNDLATIQGQADFGRVSARSWEAVRQTPAFAVALDIARQERRSYLKKQEARKALEGTMTEGAEGLIEDEASLDFFRGALGAYRNDNNVLWGAARMLAAMVDNDDELGALQVLRSELDCQEAGKVEDPYDRWKKAQTR